MDEEICITGPKETRPAINIEKQKRLSAETLLVDY